ncbi:MAG: FKBP-type peptidyl-prolyl cis-trans isomerase [Planctomycetes bacterium]|nr:FKBP-type peptidyl-prolyl cis-trans isomerase [Planctomycetota bacterium]
MRLRAIIPSLLVACAAAADPAPAPIDLTGGQPVATPPMDEAALVGKASYIFGQQIAQQIKQLELDPARVQAALADFAAGKPPEIAEAEFQQVITAFQAMMQAKQLEKVQKLNETNPAWLAENGKKEGVTTTASGLQYSVTKSGTGATPTRADQVMANYSGKLLDGTEFDASAKHGGPVTFPVGGVIPGWTEALQLMKEGDSWTLYIPSNLAYGERGQPPTIGPNQILIFDIELVKVLAKDGGPGLDVAPVPKANP